jgi:inhibitor of cysteine peptidase
MRYFAIATLLVAACASPTPATPAAPAKSAPASVDLDNAPDGAKVTLRRGSLLKVILDGNATTGFQWQMTANLAPVLSQIGDRIFVAKSADTHLVGLGGANIFGFRAESPGQVQLQFDYRRSWETVPPAKTVRYEVTIE